MTKPPFSRRARFWIALIVLTPVALLMASLAVDAFRISKAKPPKHVRTLEDFMTWKAGSIRGQGEFETGGVTYTVMLCPAARSLASGPSAYLFDTNGQFVDWTADMGDFRTVKHRFDLTGGVVKNIRHTKP